MVDSPGVPPVLRAESLGLVWPDGTPALAAISLQMTAGEKVALLGKNGSGKSTFLRLLAGRCRPTSGELELFGQKDLTRVGKRIAYLPQELTLDPEMTAAETLELIAGLLGLPDRVGQVKVAAERFGLGPHLKKRVSELSGGWRRRLDLALFFLDRRDLLLLDEPGTGLDAEGEEILFAELEEQSRQGATIVLSGHDAQRLASFTGRALLFAGGRVVAEGSPEVLAPKRHDEVREFEGKTAGRGGDGSGRGGGPGRGAGRLGGRFGEGA